MPASGLSFLDAMNMKPPQPEKLPPIYEDQSRDTNAAASDWHAAIEGRQPPNLANLGAADSWHRGVDEAAAAERRNREDQQRHEASQRAALAASQALAQGPRPTREF